jgi:methylmalonyl-CoA/ethylmalonyl-CoA epimerase
VVGRIHHIGIAVHSLAAAARVYEEGLGLFPAPVEEVPGQQVKLVMIPVGESRVELLEATSPEGPIGRFLSSRGEGVHHLALVVDDLQAALEQARQAGLRLIDERPREGAHGTKVAFIHPRSTHGVLLELVEESASRPAGGGE